MTNRKLINYKTLTLILIILISLINYSNSIEASFHFDDKYTIVENPKIKKIGDLSSIISFSPSRPLLFLTFALNYHFGGLQTKGYHLVNIFLHILNGLLLFFIVTISFKYFISSEENYPKQSMIIALISSLLFLSHPIQTEAVTYIISRSSVLCTTFYLLSFYLFIEARGKFQESEQAGQEFSIFYISFSIFFFLLAMATKEIAATLPVIVLLYEYIFISGRDRKSFLRRLGKYYWPLFLVPLGVFLFRYYFLEQGSALPQARNIYSHLITEARVVINYLRLLLFPVNLNVDPNFPISTSIIELSVIFSLGAIVITLTAALKVLSNYKLISFSIFWFFITLLPSSSIFPLDDVMAEHRLYLPSLGICLFAGTLIHQLAMFGSQRFSSQKTGTIITTALVGIVLFFSLGVIFRNSVYKDDYSLWKDTLKKSPRKARVINNFANALKDKGLPDQALIKYQEAIKYDPHYVLAQMNLGIAYLKKGMYHDAVRELSKAIALKSDYAQAYFNLGLARMNQGRYDEGLQAGRKALEIDPNNADAHNLLGALYYRKGMVDEAIVEFKKALENNFLHLQAIDNLGVAYLAQGKINEAIKEFNRALGVNDRDVEAYNNLGVAYLKKGDKEEARLQFVRALQIKPQFGKARLNLKRLDQQ
jgi:Tfp pilus assembly protein PilF